VALCNNHIQRMTTGGSAGVTSLHGNGCHVCRSFSFLNVSVELHLFCSDIVWRWMEFVERVYVAGRALLCALGSERKPVVRALFYVAAACFGL